jgi:hypothetical protein
MSPGSHSVTRWIERLKDDDPHAAAVLWERFVARMLAVARPSSGPASCCRAWGGDRAERERDLPFSRRQ